jgi:membrane protein
MLAYFDTAIGWPEVFKRTLKETQADRALGLAAELAYYFFLSLFPAILVLLALASLIPSLDVAGRATNALAGVAPPDVINIVRDQLTKVSQSGHGGLLSFGLLAALWSSSSAMVSVIDALDQAYDVKDLRSWWRQRLTAILLTVGVAIFIVAAFTLVVAGPQLADLVASDVGLGAVFTWGWKILQWPIALALVAVGIGLIYYFAPDVEQDWVWLTPGALLATVLWLVASLAFRFYVVHFGSYNATYGTIGGVIVLLTWLYVSALAILVGAEMNAEIEHASPHYLATPEPLQGQRRVIGARAARQYRERQFGTPAAQPAAKAADVIPTATPHLAPGRASAIVAGLIAALVGRRTRT